MDQAHWLAIGDKGESCGEGEVAQKGVKSPHLADVSDSLPLACLSRRVLTKADGYQSGSHPQMRYSTLPRVKLEQLIMS